MNSSQISRAHHFPLKNFHGAILRQTMVNYYRWWTKPSYSNQTLFIHAFRVLQWQRAIVAVFTVEISAVIWLFLSKAFGQWIFYFLRLIAEESTGLMLYSDWSRILFQTFDLKALWWIAKAWLTAERENITYFRNAAKSLFRLPLSFYWIL